MDFLLVVPAGVGDKDLVVLAYNHVAASSACQSDRAWNNYAVHHHDMLCPRRYSTRRVNQKRASMRN